MASRSKSEKSDADAPRVGVEVVRSRLHDAARARGESLAPEVITPAIQQTAEPRPTKATRAKTAPAADAEAPARPATKQATKAAKRTRRRA